MAGFQVTIIGRLTADRYAGRVKFGRPITASKKGYPKGMSTIEQYYKNCKTFREQLARIEQHIKGNGIYTAFDFGKVQSILAEYEMWAQANTGVIDAALKTANS